MSARQSRKNTEDRAGRTERVGQTTVGEKEKMRKARTAEIEKRAIQLQEN